MRGKSGQISIEYLLIISLALAILIPGSLLFYNYSRTSNDQFVSNQVNRIGNQIISNAEEVYTIGRNSWVTLELQFPQGTTNAYIVENSELVIEYVTTAGTTQAVFFSDINLNGTYNGNLSPSFTSGFTKLKVESIGDRILIGEIS